MNGPYLFVKEGKILLSIDGRLKFIAEAIPGRSWDAGSRCWQIPPLPGNVAALKSKIHNLVIDPTVTSLIAEHSQRLLQVSREKDIPWQEAVPIEPLPLKDGIIPYQHQVAAYNVGGSILGVFKK